MSFALHWRIPAIAKTICFLLLCLLIAGYWSIGTRYQPGSAFIPSLSREGSSQSSNDSRTSPGWPKIIWQTSKVPAEELLGEDKDHYESWQYFNPDYVHELMTDDKMAQYVRENFGGSEIEEVYFEIEDYILLSDLIRYLILLHDGGVYNDLDVGCERSVDTWVPKAFQESAGVVLGVEVDNKFGPDGRTFQNGEDLFELVNWTMMAKPGQPFIRFLVQRVLQNIHRMAADQGTSINDMELHTIQQVLQTTGPAALTTAFFDYATNFTGSDVTYKNFTKLTEPKTVGEVVILPIHAFGAGHQVEWAGLVQNPNLVLVHHYFSGSWYSDHYWSPPTKSAGNGDKGDDGPSSES